MYITRRGAMQLKASSDREGEVPRASRKTLRSRKNTYQVSRRMWEHLPSV